MLEFGAIDLDASPRIPKQSLGHRLDHACLSRTRRTEEQQIAHGTPGGIQSRQKHLIDLYYFFDRRVLSYDPAVEGGFKFSCVIAASVRIEHCGEIRSHNSLVRDFRDLSFRPFRLFY